MLGRAAAMAMQQALEKLRVMSLHRTGMTCMVKWTQPESCLRRVRQTSSWMARLRALGKLLGSCLRRAR